MAMARYRRELTTQSLKLAGTHDRCLGKGRQMRQGQSPKKRVLSERQRDMRRKSVPVSKCG